MKVNLKIMQNFILLIAVCGLVNLLAGCEVKGCTDSNALNYDVDATKNSGCNYSTVTFYASAPAYNGIAIAKIDLNVGGNSLGSITGVWPSGPGNCSAANTLAFKFTDGKTIDWNSKVFLANGSTILGSGTVSPSNQECIKVNVTR